MTHVLIIVENLPVPLDRRVWQQARALNRVGYEVSVICPKAGKYQLPYEELENIKIYRHILPFEGHGILSYVGEYLVAWMMETYLAVRIALKSRVTIIQACNPPDNIFLIGLLLRSFCGSKFVFDHHDPFAELFSLKFPRQQTLKRFVSWFERQSLRRADQVITTSEELRRLALTRHNVPLEKISLVRSGFDLTRLRDAEPDTSLKRGRRHLAIYIGVMGAQDGIDLLLEAASCVVHEHGRTDIQFVLAGGGAEMANMQSLCTKRGLDDYVDFAGYLEGPKLYQLLATADMGLCPDPKNDFNDKLSMNKVLEYMAFAIPIVQFDLNEGLLLAGEAAKYAQNNDPKNLARVVIDLIDRPDERVRMGAIGRERVLKQFSWEEQERRYLETYAKLVSNSEEAHSQSSKPDAAKRVFGFLPSSHSLDQTVDTILQSRRTDQDGIGLVVTPNIHHVAKLRNSVEFRRAYDHATMILCDGWPVYSYARRRGHQVRFVTGCDLISRILDWLPRILDHKVCLIIDNQETEHAIEEWARAKTIQIPTMTLVPPFGFIENDSWCRDTVAALRDYRPTLLIMGVGAPQSEIFIDRYRNELPPCWALCVGQAVKVKLGLVRRAPALVRWLRGEWLWRLVQEPRRLTPRYIRSAAGFLLSMHDDLREIRRGDKA